MLLHTSITQASGDKHQKCSRHHFEIAWSLSSRELIEDNAPTIAEIMSHSQHKIGSAKVSPTTSVTASLCLTEAPSLSLGMSHKMAVRSQFHPVSAGKSQTTCASTIQGDCRQRLRGMLDRVQNTRRMHKGSQIHRY